MNDSSNDRALDPSGIGAVAALLAIGGFSILAPDYFDARGWHETAWYVAGGISAFIGGIGLAVELSRSSEGETLSELAVGVVLLTIAVAGGFALTVWSLPSPLAGVLRVVAVFLGFFGFFGLGAGLARIFQEGSTSSRRHAGREWLALLAGAVGLATAALNFIAAVSSERTG